MELSEGLIFGILIGKWHRVGFSKVESVNSGGIDVFFPLFASSLIFEL